MEYNDMTKQQALRELLGGVEEGEDNEFIIFLQEDRPLQPQPLIPQSEPPFQGDFSRRMEELLLGDEEGVAGMGFDLRGIEAVELPGYLQDYLSPEEFNEYSRVTREALRSKETEVRCLVAGDEARNIPGIPLSRLLVLGHNQFGSSLRYLIENHTVVQAYMAEGISFNRLAEMEDRSLKALLTGKETVQTLMAQGVSFEDLCQLSGENYGHALEDLLQNLESEESRRWIQEHRHPQQAQVNIGGFDVPRPGSRVGPSGHSTGRGL